MTLATWILFPSAFPPFKSSPASDVSLTLDRPQHSFYRLASYRSLAQVKSLPLVALYFFPFFFLQKDELAQRRRWCQLSRWNASRLFAGQSRRPDFLLTHLNKSRPCLASTDCCIMGTQEVRERCSLLLIADCSSPTSRSGQKWLLFQRDHQSSREGGASGNGTKTHKKNPQLSFVPLRCLCVTAGKD